MVWYQRFTTWVLVYLNSEQLSLIFKRIILCLETLKKKFISYMSIRVYTWKAFTAFWKQFKNNQLSQFFKLGGTCMPFSQKNAYLLQEHVSKIRTCNSQLVILKKITCQWWNRLLPHKIHDISLCWKAGRNLQHLISHSIDYKINRNRTIFHLTRISDIFMTPNVVVICTLWTACLQLNFLYARHYNSGTKIESLCTPNEMCDTISIMYNNLSLSWRITLKSSTIR